MSKPKPKKLKPSILIIFLGVIIAIFYFLFYMQNENDNSREDSFDEAAYIEKMNTDRQLKDIEFTDSTLSRFNAEERASFHGLNYFSPNPNYRIEASFSVDTNMPAFKMPTNTERSPNYRIYAYLDFQINDTACRLTVFQNMDFKDHPEHGEYLFIPFSDKTNGSLSYGAGRYIDISIPKENKIFIDFNEAYNPYCAYSDRWSCPLVPFENYLNISIPAGEKKYKH